MKTKQILTVLSITIIYFLSGWLIYGVVLDGLYKSNMVSYPGLMKETPAVWAYFLGNLAWSTLIVYVFSLAGIKTFMKGLITAAIISFCIGFSFDIVMLGTMNLYNTTAAIVDILTITITGGLLGGLAAYFLGMGKS